MASAQFVNPSSFNYQSQSPSGPANPLMDALVGTSTTNNAYNWAQMNYQNQWNEYMANTQYQRGVQDMLNAGINPMVATAQNVGSAKASAPVSAGGSASNFNFKNSMIGQGYATMLKTFSNAMNVGSQTGASMLAGLL